MRKSFDGLCGLINGKLQRNPRSGEVFIFINKRRDKIKLLHWEAGGFVLYYKRLEQGTFLAPPFEGDSYRMNWWELTMMISGITASEIRQRKRYNPQRTVDKYLPEAL
jgi:transposase